MKKGLIERIHIESCTRNAGLYMCPHVGTSARTSDAIYVWVARWYAFSRCKRTDGDCVRFHVDRRLDWHEPRPQKSTRPNATSVHPSWTAAISCALLPRNHLKDILPGQIGRLGCIAIPYLNAITRPESLLLKWTAISPSLWKLLFAQTIYGNAYDFQHLDKKCYTSTLNYVCEKKAFRPLLTAHEYCNTRRMNVIC